MAKPKNSNRVFEIEQKLDKLFEAGGNKDSKRSSENIHQSGTKQYKLTVKNNSTDTSPLVLKNLSNIKIPLPPAPLNIKKLLDCKKKCKNCDEIISAQNKHIQNLQEI